MNNEVVLAFSQSGITYYGGEGLEVNSKHSIKEKVVTYEDFIDILNSSTSVSINSSDERNTLPAGTVFFDYGSNDSKTGIDIDKKTLGILIRKKRGILVFNQKPLEIAIPNLLFTFSINKGKYSVAVNIVLDKDIETFPFIDSVTLKSEFSTYPTVFPNTYNDGRVCWGNASLPKVISSSQDCYDIINTFFVSSFNNDLLDMDRIDVDYLIETYHSAIDKKTLSKTAVLYELFLQTLAKLDSFDDKLINKNKKIK